MMPAVDSPRAGRVEQLRALHADDPGAVLETGGELGGGWEGAPIPDERLGANWNDLREERPVEEEEDEEPEDDLLLQRIK